KGMFILKKKDDKTYECSFYNPESTNTASDIESKISMTGYSITTKNASTTNESPVPLELTTQARQSRTSLLNHCPSVYNIILAVVD
uniref:hypothetical protein n=1 Tax=Staphylococcus aureus TaxID=1280 RepID=UPI000AABD49D